MRTINSLTNYTLTFQQPKWKVQRYEIVFGNEVVAYLTFPKLFKYHAIASVNEAEYFLKRVGFFQNTTVVQDKNQTIELARCKSSIWKNRSTIEFHNGKIFLLRRHIFKSLIEISNNTEGIILSFKNVGFFKIKTDITMKYAASKIEELPVLVMLGCYTAVLARRQSQGAHVKFGI
jgi:hypothetical protein